MTHPTESHDFTFGCYRAEEVPSLGGHENGGDAAADDVEDAENDLTLVTDGGPGGAITCPACESDLANVQGVPACTRCAWNAH